jgi:hypothetical protein
MVCTGESDVVSEYQRFTSPSIIGSSRTAEAITKRKYNDSHLFLWFTCTGDEISPAALCVMWNKVLPNSSVLPAKPRRHRDAIILKNTGKKKKFFFYSVSLRHCQLSEPYGGKFKTDNENARGSLQREILCCACRRRNPYNCRKPN